MAKPDYYLDADMLNPLFGLYRNKLTMIQTGSSQILLLPWSLLNTLSCARRWAGTLVCRNSLQPGIRTMIHTRTPGIYNISKSNFSDPTINILAGIQTNSLMTNFQYQPGRYHQLENGVTRLGTYGQRFAVVDFQSINNCDPLSISSSQRHTKRRFRLSQVRWNWLQSNGICDIQGT
jgi:hypothetical protein